LINAGRITEWKDLPSDNWAEMMEFWHCHKPVDHNNPSAGAETDGKTTNKGYGANNVISAQQGIGLIDVTSFVLSTDDCSAVLVSVALSILSTFVNFGYGGARSWSNRLLKPPIDMVSDTTPPYQ
jgi:hypothetical protein